MSRTFIVKRHRQYRYSREQLKHAYISSCACVYLIVEDDHDKHAEQHRLHQKDDVMRPETKRDGSSYRPARLLRTRAQSSP